MIYSGISGARLHKRKMSGSTYFSFNTSRLTCHFSCHLSRLARPSRYHRKQWRQPRGIGSISKKEKRKYVTMLQIHLLSDPKLSHLVSKGCGGSQTHLRSKCCHRRLGKSTPRSYNTVQVSKYGDYCIPKEGKKRVRPALHCGTHRSTYSHPTSPFRRFVSSDRSSTIFFCAASTRSIHPTI